MERDDRNGRDAAGVGPYARERERLVPMSTLESWTVSSGEPDIRGWEIHTVSGRQLGSVADLLIDRDAGEAVLLDVDLPGTDQHTFVPIRVVEIDRARRIVLMDSADVPELAIARDDNPAGETVVSETRTVTFPASDRELHATQPSLADTVPPREVAGAERDAAAAEQRQAELRIDRTNTGF